MPLPVSSKNLAVLCDAYKVGPREGEQLKEMRAKAVVLGWWDKYADVLTAEMAEHCELEQEADRIDAYSANLIPGFLQTLDYANYVQDASDAVLPPEERQPVRRVELRLERQARVFAGSKTVRVLLDEGVLRRDLGDGIMGRQLGHLHDLARTRKIQLRYLPFSAGLIGTANFYVFSVDGRSIVCIDGFQTETHKEEGLITESFAQWFDQWWSQSRALP